MQQLSLILPFINGLLKTYRTTGLICLLILATNSFFSLKAQSVDPVTSIHELKDGYLIVRFPYSKAKVDTLKAMVMKSKDPNNTARLQKQLDDAIQKRDTLISDYKKAFSSMYHFSKTGYYFDYDSRDLRKTQFYKMDGSPLSREEIGTHPIYYMYFERTQENAIDALVIYNPDGLRVPDPFPNNFTRGGINFLFLKLSSKKFPAWRVDRIDKRLYKYWNAVPREQ